MKKVKKFNKFNKFDKLNILKFKTELNALNFKVSITY